MGSIARASATNKGLRPGRPPVYIRVAMPPVNWKHSPYENPIADDEVSYGIAQDMVNEWRAAGGRATQTIRAFLTGGAMTAHRKQRRKLYHEVTKQLRALLGLGLINHDDLEWSDMPGEAPRLLVDNDACRIMLFGRIRKRGSSPEVERARLWIVSNLDGGTGGLELRVEPNRECGHFYFLVQWRPIERAFPRLGDHLAAFGLLATFKGKPNRVLLQRLVVASEGKMALNGSLEVHHLPATSGTGYAGFTTLNCEARNLIAVFKRAHEAYHRIMGDDHYHARVGRVMGKAGWPPTRVELSSQEFLQLQRLLGLRPPAWVVVVP